MLPPPALPGIPRVVQSGSFLPSSRSGSPAEADPHDRAGRRSAGAPAGGRARRRRDGPAERVGEQPGQHRAGRQASGRADLVDRDIAEAHQRPFQAKDQDLHLSHPPDRRRDGRRDRGQGRGLGRWDRDPLDPGGEPASRGRAVHAVDRLDMGRERLRGIYLIGWPPHRIVKRVGERARLLVAGLDQHQRRPVVGRRRALLGAGRHLGDQMQEMLDRLGRERPVGSLPALALAGFEVRDQERQVDHDVAVVEPGGEVGGVQVPGPEPCSSAWRSSTAVK